MGTVFKPAHYVPSLRSRCLSLGRQNAYDAAYLALAETLNAELWTLASPLYRNAIAKSLTVTLLQT